MDLPPNDPALRRVVMPPPEIADGPLARQQPPAEAVDNGVPAFTRPAVVGQHAVQAAAAAANRPEEPAPDASAAPRPADTPEPLGPPAAGTGGPPDKTNPPPPTGGSGEVPGRDGPDNADGAEQPPPQPKGQPPRVVVFTTERANIQRLDDHLKAAGVDLGLVSRLEPRLAEERGVFGEEGVRYREVKHVPPNLGYEQRRFLLSGESLPHLAIVDLARLAVPDLEVIPSTQLLDADLAAEDIVVLKRPDLDTHGVNKYLITGTSQREALDRFRHDHPDEAADWVLQPFVEGRVAGLNTSLRIVGDATGGLTAAALLYSRPRDGFDQPHVPSSQPELRRPDDGKWEGYFSDPSSPYYLAAHLDIRSNAGTRPTDRVVPLAIDGELGADMSRITRRDRIVAEEYGLEGLDAPADTLDQAARLYQAVGARVGLLLGGDFIRGSVGPDKFVELNVDPAPDTVQLWHNLPSDNDATRRFMLERAAANLARLSQP